HRRGRRGFRLSARPTAAPMGRHQGDAVTGMWGSDTRTAPLPGCGAGYGLYAGDDLSFSRLGFGLNVRDGFFSAPFRVFANVFDFGFYRLAGLGQVIRFVF